MNDLFVENRILTVFELNMVEIVRERFKQIRSEAPVKYFEKPNDTKTNHCTPLSQKGLFCST